MTLVYSMDGIQIHIPIVLFKKHYFLFFGCTRSLLVCMGFSLVAVSRGYSRAVVHRLLNEVASLVTDHGL